MTGKRWKEMSKAERHEACLARRRQGLSATEIAVDLGAPSRNAILGMFHRIANAASKDGVSPPAGTIAPIKRAPPGEAKRVRRPPRPDGARHPSAKRTALAVPPPAQVHAISVLPQPVDPGTGASTVWWSRPRHRCGWLIDPYTVPITERRCCGAPTDGADAYYCDWHLAVVRPELQTATVGAAP